MGPCEPGQVGNEAAISSCSRCGGLLIGDRLRRKSYFLGRDGLPMPNSDPHSEPSPSYVVVARRYRPQGFGELIGQEHVSQALSNAIATHRVGHAYLFTGARGTGKTSTARIFAKALNCVNGPTAEPCNQCDSCQSISTGDDVDVLEIDGASNRGIDEIRQLRQNVNVRPSRARFKIYIIDEVHMLTREAFNALLKTLEEPPEHVKFIFCTTEATKIPITILSRCQRFDFAGISTRAIFDRLRQIVEAEGVQAEDEALEVLARRAAGSMRDSQSLLEQLLSFASERITVADVHGMLGTAGDQRLTAMVKNLVERNAAAALSELECGGPGRRRRGPVDRAAFRLLPRLHGGRGRLPGRYVSVCLDGQQRRRDRGRTPAGLADDPGRDADPRSDAFAHEIQHAGADPGRTGPGADLQPGRPGGIVQPDRPVARSREQGAGSREQGAGSIVGADRASTPPTAPRAGSEAHPTAAKKKYEPAVEAPVAQQTNAASPAPVPCSLPPAPGSVLLAPRPAARTPPAPESDDDDDSPAETGFRARCRQCGRDLAAGDREDSRHDRRSCQEVQSAGSIGHQPSDGLLLPGACLLQDGLPAARASAAIRAGPEGCHRPDDPGRVQAVGSASAGQRRGGAGPAGRCRRISGSWRRPAIRWSGVRASCSAPNPPRSKKDNLQERIESCFKDLAIWVRFGSRPASSAGSWKSLARS